MYQQGIGTAQQQEGAEADSFASDLGDLDALECEPDTLEKGQDNGDEGASERPGELLQWCQHLDFDAYMDDWTATACTLGSEALLPESEGAWLAQLETASATPTSGFRVHQGQPSGSVAMAGCKPLSFEQALVSSGAWAPFKGGAAPAAGVTSGLAMS